MFLDHLILRDELRVLLGNFVPPVTECTFGELHDVALVNQRDRWAFVLDCILDCGADQSFGAFLADRLDPDSTHLREPNRGCDSHFIAQPADHFVGVRRAGTPFNACVHVLRVLTEEHHIHVFRVFHRSRRADMLDRAHARIQVEQLPQGHVETADSSSDRGRQRALDRYEVLANGLDGLLWEVQGLTSIRRNGDNFLF